MIEPIDVDDPQVEEMDLLDERKQILQTYWANTLKDLGVIKNSKLIK